MSRKLFYTAERVHSMFAKLRGDFHAQHFAMLCEVVDLKRQVGEMQTELAQLRELRAASLARAQAHAELASLYREREIQRARAAERDPNAAVN